MTRLAERYAGYTDAELARVLRNPGGYITEAIRVACLEADRRGGVGELLRRVRAADEERARIDGLVLRVSRRIVNGLPREELLWNLDLDGLDGQDLDEIVERAFLMNADSPRDSGETPGSIVMALGGGTVATLVGAIYSTLLIFGAGEFSVAAAVGLMLLCYALVAITARRWLSPMVQILTIVSIALSLFLGAQSNGRGPLPDLLPHDQWPPSYGE